MTKRSIFTLFLFFITASLGAKTAEYLHVTTGTQVSVFLPSDRIEIFLDLPKTGANRASLKIFNFDDKIVYSKSFSGEEMKKSQRFRFPFRIFGVFRAQISLYDTKNKMIESEETTFASIRDVRLKTLRPDSPFGIGAYYAMRFSPEELPVAARLQNMLGAAWDRDELLWDIVEPEKGKWTWDRTDRTIKAAHDNNILILGLLDYWGKWTTPLTDQGYADYARYVKRVVNRYKPGGEFAQVEGWKDGYGISNWEIWNEPATFWNGSGAQFGRLLKEAYKAAKEADPNAMVFFSEAGDTFNSAVIAEAGKDSLDGVTPHYYCPPRTPEEGDMDRNMVETVGSFEKLGVSSRPFWVSEFGWHSTMDPVQMRHQAVSLVRAHIYGLAAGLDKFFWYNFVNDDRNKDGQHFGLVNREDFTPRFGFGAYAAMVYFLDGARFYNKVEILKPARIFVFEKENGSVAVLWSSGARGSLTMPLPRRAALYDIMGNPISHYEIPLRSDPVYLEAPDTDSSSLAFALGEAQITGISSAEMKILPLAGSLKTNPPVKILIENVGKKPIQGELTLTPPEEWSVKNSVLPVDPITSGSKSEISFSFAQMKTRPDNRYKINALFREKSGEEAVAIAELSELAASYGSPGIDGDPGDWKNARFIYLDTQDKAVGLVPYMDWNLSARASLMWDEKYLYFLAIVQDNVFSQDHTGELIWEGDSFQLGFDTTLKKDKEKPDKGKYLYGLAKTKKGFETWSWPVMGKMENKPAPEIKFSFQSPEKDVYVYEAAIPRKLLSPLEMKEGAQFAFTLLLNDNDGGGRRGWLEWTPGIGTGFNPNYFTLFTLVK